MAIQVPPTEPAELRDSDADALFEEAREIERRRRWRRFAGGGAAAGIALAVGIGFGIAGGGGGASVAQNGSGHVGPAAGSSRQPQVFTATVAASSSVCSLASHPATAGNPPPGQCVTILPNGHRYQCPIGVVNSFGGNAGQATTDSACHRVAAPTVPASWRPAIRQMHQVKACLQTAGMTVGAGVVPPVAQRAYQDTPIATVLIAGAETQPATPGLTTSPASSRPTVVSFYLTTALARQTYNRTISTVTRQGQSMAVRGRVLYTWNNQTAGPATAERRCVRAI